MRSSLFCAEIFHELVIGLQRGQDFRRFVGLGQLLSHLAEEVDIVGREDDRLNRLHLRKGRRPLDLKQRQKRHAGTEPERRREIARPGERRRLARR